MKKGPSSAVATRPDGPAGSRPGPSWQTDGMAWRLLADATLLVHLSFIGFTVVGGFLARRRRWVAAPHLVVVLYGVTIQVLGFTCPLTPLENEFRHRAGQRGYDGGFVEHYLVPIIYPGEPTTMVTAVLVAGLVAVTTLAYLPLVASRFPRQPDHHTQSHT